MGRVALAARRLLEQADQAQMVDAMQLVLSHGTAQDTPITENPIQVKLNQIFHLQMVSMHQASAS